MRRAGAWRITGTCQIRGGSERCGARCTRWREIDPSNTEYFQMTPQPSRVHRWFLLLPILPSLGFGTACSILDPLEAKPVRVDSIQVVLEEAQESPVASVIIYGKIGGRYCDRLTGVRRVERSDSLLRQFVATGGRGLCADSPLPLRYEERVTRRAARALTYIVAQPGQDPVSVQIPPL